MFKGGPSISSTVPKPWSSWSPEVSTFSFSSKTRSRISYLRSPAPPQSSSSFFPAYITVIDRKGGKLYIDLKGEKTIVASKARKVLNKAGELVIRGAHREGLERDGEILKGQKIRNKEVVRIVSNLPDDKDEKGGVDESSSSGDEEDPGYHQGWQEKLKDFEAKREKDLEAIDENYKKLIEDAWENNYARRCLFPSCKEMLAAPQQPSPDNNKWSSCDDCAAAEPIRQSLICPTHSHIASYKEHVKTHAQKKRNEPDDGHDEEENPRGTKKAKRDVK